MEAALLHLIFNIAAVLVAEIAEHLGEHPFQGIILHLSARLFTGLNLLVAVVTDIEGSTIKMARILGSITVSGTQFRHIILGALHRTCRQIPSVPKGTESGRWS